jgi:hypothetical protein
MVGSGGGDYRLERIRLTTAGSWSVLVFRVTAGVYRKGTTAKYGRKRDGKDDASGAVVRCADVPLNQ